MQIRTPFAHIDSLSHFGRRSAQVLINVIFFQIFPALSLTVTGMTAIVFAQDTDARLAMACGSCHGLDGQRGGAIPALAGREEQELLDLMRTLKEPADGITIMPRILRAYNDDELKALARHFASIVP